MMLRSEIKKVFSRSKNKIAMILLLIILAATSILTVDRVEYVDEDGNASSGIAAARKPSAEQNKWAGYLTGDVLAEAVRKNDQTIGTEGALSDDIKKQDKAYAKMQGILVIAELINNAFSGWRDYDGCVIDNISPEDAEQVYERRISALECV